MNIEQRILLLERLGGYLSGDHAEWQEIKEKAHRENGWFIPTFIDLATENICHAFLQKEALERWVHAYGLPAENTSPATIGLVMAGNIPMVGFHDLLCCFITGNRVRVKPSSKDAVLIRHVIGKLYEWDPSVKDLIHLTDEQLKGCDAYIATGSNNTSRYFEQYFGKYPHIIRRNRTSVAILDGTETTEELAALADDMMLFFGLGCRNVTQIQVPTGYDFIPLLEAMKRYSWAADHNKYRNNYDHQLALHILNGQYYMSDGTTLLVEQASPFSPIAQVHYQFHDDANAVLERLQGNEDIQAIVGHLGIPFGLAQKPSLTDYADGVDTMEWLNSLNK